MKTICLMIFLVYGFTLNAQNVVVENFSGTVKIESGKDGKADFVKKGLKLNANSIVTTSKNSFADLRTGSKSFKLNSFSSININSLRKMSADEFLLALAKEDLSSAGSVNTKNSTDYSKQKADRKKPFIESDDNGIKKLNGAVQLAESGFDRQAVIAAMEAYRKFPAVKNITAYRLYFADILVKHKLYDEAQSEYISLKKLSLDSKEKKEVEEKLAFVKKKNTK